MRIPEDKIKAVKMASDGFPDVNVPQSVRNKPEWAAAWARAAYGMSADGYWGRGYTDTFREKYALLRKYAAGQQPETPYTKRYSLPQGDTSKSGNGGLLITADPTILAILPGMLRRMRSRLTAYPTVPQVRANDPLSINERQKAELDMLVNIHMRPQVQALEAALGGARSFENAPATEEEVMLHMESGMFKETVAILFETLIAQGLEQARYDRVRDEIVRLDLIPCGRGAVGIFPRADGPVDIKRIPPENILHPDTTTVDGADCMWVGVMRNSSTDEVTREGGLTDDEAEEIQKKYTRPIGTLGWPDADWRGANVLGNQIRNANVLGNQIRNANVPIVDFYFIAKREEDYKETEPNEETGQAYDIRKIAPDKLLDDSEVRPGISRKTVKSLAVYGCSWVIGSDIYWNTGLLPCQPCVAPGIPYLPVQFVIPENYGVTSMSLVEEVATTVDQLQLSWLNLQNIMSKNSPPVLVYFKKALSYIAAGDKTSSDKVFQEMRAKGTLGIDMPDEFYNNLGGMGAPVFSLDLSKISNAIETEMMWFSFLMSNLMRGTGFTDITAGGAVDERKGKAVAQMEVQNTIDSMKTLAKAMDTLAVNMVRPMVGFQIAAITSSIPQKAKYWARSIGSDASEAILKLASKPSGGETEMELDSIGLGVLPYPDPQEVQDLKEAMDIAMTGRDGKQPMMTLSDKMVVNRYINNGRLLAAQAYMMGVERRRTAEQAKREQAAAKQAQEGQQALAAQNAEAQKAFIEAKGMLDAEKIKLTGQQKAEAEARKTQGDLVKIDKEAESAAMLLRMGAAIEAMNTKLEAVLNSKAEKEAIQLQAAEDRRTEVVIAEHRPPPATGGGA